MSYYFEVENGKVSRKKKKKGTNYTVDVNGKVTKEVVEDDIAPVKKTTTITSSKTNSKKKKQKWYEGFLQLGDALSDGYQLGDLTKTYTASVTDATKNLATGIVGMGEKVVDAGAYVAGGVGGLLGADEFKKKTQKFMEKDLYDEKKVAEKIVTHSISPIAWTDKVINGKKEDNSVFGDKTDSLVQSGGQLLATAGLQTVVGVPWYLTTATTAFGGQVETALREGANYEQAGGSALISAGAEVLFEKLGGGIKFGGQTLDDLLVRPLTEKISNKLFKKVVNLVADASFEGLEEAFTSATNRLGSKLYKEESIGELLTSEEAMDEYLDSFVGGAIMGGVAGGFNKSNLTENEQKVVDKEVENRIAKAKEEGKTIKSKDKAKIYDEVLQDLSKGSIDIDTIESALGGETYETYKNIKEQEDTLKKEQDLLNYIYKDQISLRPNERLTQINEQIKQLNTAQVKEQLSNDVFGLAKDSRLAESYNERARRSQAFEADLSKYDAKQQEVVKKAIDSGILNNTNKTHDFVDLIAKISTDKGITFDFTNNQKLRESGFAVAGKTVNGYKTGDGVIGVNIDSKKSLNTIVGHEITHVLEGTELYSELQKAVKKYAITKKDYDARVEELTKLYTKKNGKLIKGANIESEVTADLVGDYLFTDKEFIKNLSVEQPSIFKKIFDEIKYLCRVVTADSKEARQLEKVKRTFEKAYKQNTNTSTDTKYALQKIVDNKVANRLTSEEWDKVKRYVSEHNGLNYNFSKASNGDIIIEVGNKMVYTDANQDSPGISQIIEFESDYETDIDYARSEIYAVEKGLTSTIEEAYKTIRLFTEIRDINQYKVEDRTNMGRYDKRTERGKSQSDIYHDKFLQERIRSANKIIQSVNNNKSKVSSKDDAFFDGDTKYSLSDSNGKTLTKEQQEYFKDSKVRDENGNLKVMYHGTTESFTVFDRKKAKYSGLYGRGFYFSDSSSHAGQYGNQMEVYLDIKNPVSTDETTITKAELKKFLEEVKNNEDDYSFENYGYDATTDSVASSIYGKSDFNMLYDIDQTAIGNMVETVELFNEVTGKNYDGFILPTETVVFNSNQIKNTNNTNPTADSDIRFSLSESVEETKDLVAIHNMSADELAKTLKLGGLPMPSVAIIKAKQNFDKYGDVSLILNKDSIDPKVSKDNKVYGGDAWTPVYPTIEYKVNEDVEQRVKAKYEELYDKVGYDEARPLYRYGRELEEMLNRDGGEEAMLKKLYNDTKIMQLYLEDSGKGRVEPVKKEVRTELSDAEKEMSQWFIDKLGEGIINNSNSQSRTEFMKEYREQIKSVYESYLCEKLGLTVEEAKNTVDKTSNWGLLSPITNARKYLKNGGVTITEDTDHKATDEIIKKKATDGYKEWIDSLFKGSEEKTGIRNNLETFTKSGNQRSWDALHWENTLENVVKVMKSQDQTGADAMAPSSALFAVSQKKYGSIDDIKADSNRLGEVSEDEYKALEESYANRLSEIANSITEENTRNPYTAMDESANLIVEAVREQKTKEGMLSYMQKWNKKVTDKTVDDIISLVSDISNMPTGYFEAKPQRAVGLDEVGVFVIPYNADAKLKQELLNKGYSIAEYNPDVEGDRQRVVNQFEDYKFSLANREQITAPYGNYNVYGKDIALEKPTQSNIFEQNNMLEEIAPTQKTTSNTETSTEEDEVVEQSVAPNEADDFEKLVQSYMDEAPDFMFDDDQIRAWAEEQARNHTPDTIIPKKSSQEVESPLAERDIKTIGRKIKTNAYMYENPEVKPFFQKEAQVMLWELKNSTDGERIKKGVKYGLDNETGAFENEWTGIKRQTSKALAYLKDEFSYSRDDLEKGLLAIIKDHGAENNAVSKRIEFMIDERLRDGYKDFIENKRVAPNQEYINFLSEKQITEYSDEAFNSLQQNNWEQVAQEDIAPTEELVEDIEQVLYSLEDDKNKELNQIDTELEGLEDTDEPGISVNESYSAKVENYNNAIEGYKNARAEIETAFDEAIQKKTTEYENLKRKDTKKATDLLMQIENLKLRKANNLSNIDSRIEKSQIRVDNMIKNEDSIKQGMYRIRRRDLHTNIIDNMKHTFSKKGFEFDEVLKNAKNKSTIASNDNTPQRYMEKTLGYKEGQILADLTVNQVAQNESDATKWVNENVSLLKQISKEYGIKPRSKESAIAQMYAEGFYANEDGKLVKYGDKELEADIKDAKVRENIKKLSKDTRIREIYDNTLDMINESRIRNAYPEIPKRDNYFMHFIEMDDAFSRLGIPFNPNDIKSKDLPTDLNGMTADLKPGQPFFASSMQRKGYETTYDLIGGVEKYLNSAKNQIYHIDDIQALRATRNYIADMYGQAHGFENLDNMTEEEISDKIQQIKGSHLSSFARFLNEEANVIAGKTALIDRGFEGLFGRKSLTFMDTINRQVGSNMIGFNVSSSLTNFLSVMQSMAKSSKADTFKAFTQTVSNKISSTFGGKTDGFADANPGIIRRKGIDKFTKTPFEKITEPGYVLMTAIDDISTEIIVRTKFNELTRKGMSEEQAHIESDKWAHRILGDRSLGQQPLYYNSKALGLITKFQLEVRNQLDSQFYDTIQEAKISTEDIDNALARNAVKTAKVTSTLVQLAVLQHVFGKAFESVAGYNPAFDMIEVLMQTFGFDDDEDSEDTALDNVEQGFLALLEDMPYASVLTGGGRIPVSSALPIKEFVYGKDSYGRDKPRGETLKEALPYYLFPTGYGQFKKTKKGLEMFSDEHPVSGSYTDSGKLRFPVEDTPTNRVQAGLFGQYANENARYYFDNDIAPLNEKQTQEYIDVDMPIKDYWNYREGMKGKSKLSDKMEYISSLDIPINKKNILVNNATTRKEPIDMTDYDEYTNFDEFDFATQNPKKYKFLQENGISYKDYTKNKESKKTYDWAYRNPKKYEFLQSIDVSYKEYSKNDDTKDAYTWAYNNQDKYVLSKAIADDVVTYKKYTKELSKIRADKYPNGKTISGSKKKKVLNYINSLDADYGEKLILYKSVYEADDTYNRKIVDYLNNREDISYDDMNTILRQLGFTVTSDGTIYWN